MSKRSGVRAISRVIAPSACLAAVALLGLLFGTYWQYVLAISISAAVVGSALSMLVGYARCITIATGAMMAIGAYGAARSGRARPRSVSAGAVRLQRCWAGLPVSILAFPGFAFAATISRWSRWSFRRS